MFCNFDDDFLKNHELENRSFFIMQIVTIGRQAYCKVENKVSCAHLFSPKKGPSKFQVALQSLYFCMQLNGTKAIGQFSWLMHILDQK